MRSRAGSRPWRNLMSRTAEASSSRHPSSRVVRVLGLISAAAFGVGIALFKGTGGGIRYAIGNLSAPWLVLPLIVTVVTLPVRRWSGSAAATGGLVALCSLVAFYVTERIRFGQVN